MAPITHEHTPGPWVVQRLEDAHHGYHWPTFTVRSPQNVCLAVVGDVDRYESERIPANARLMAAAPSLYRGCMAALAYLADPASQSFENRAEAARIIQAALAEARAEV
jgi:hypothetical protein